MNSIYCFNLIQDRCLIKIDLSLAQKIEHRYKKIFARYIFEYNISFLNLFKIYIYIMYFLNGFLINGDSMTVFILH